MSETAIKFENISKQYRLGIIGTGTLSHDLKRWWIMNVLGKEDPYIKIGSVNDRTTKGETEYVWALRNIDLDVKQGEVLGIIGKNGAGKSTLLKILSRVTTPTTGLIKAKGRIASLLEVGTGFHLEMTGRENIFLNGSIMGMNKAEIKRKFDEIVDFAGVERYIDTPVKRYSSGMIVRLGFAIAAHLEPEILVVDEVLAVGDAEFQKKAVGKMQDVSKAEGRTVLFVSHNMASVQNLCTKSIILENGSTIFSGVTEKAIDFYLNRNKTNINGIYINTNSNSKRFKFVRASVLNEKNQETEVVNNAFTAKMYIEYELESFISGLDIGFTLEHSNYGVIFGSCLKDDNLKDRHNLIQKSGRGAFSITLPLDMMKEGTYYVTLGAAIPNVEVIEVIQNALQFQVIDTSSPIALVGEGRAGYILPILKWVPTEIG
jgi:lipopolysaccharide transport system ATP-binding protein